MGSRKKKHSILAEELHKPVNRKFRKRQVKVKGIDHIWTADLADVKSLSDFNDDFNYLLLVIDIFSKFGWIIPLKDKNGKTVADAFETIFRKRYPEKIWVDRGKEFYNIEVKKLLKRYEVKEDVEKEEAVKSYMGNGIELYSTENKEKSSVVERWVRTMKEKMYKYFTDNNTHRYIEVLQDLVDDYNNTKHSTIKMTPVEASRKKNEHIVYRNIYPDSLKIKRPETPKFAVGDRVRISRNKAIFEKGYTTRWTEEVFKISKILNTDPITYKIEDLQGEEQPKAYYEKELQKTEQQVFRIEKILKEEDGKSYVKWEGYSDKFNSWVDNKDMIKIT